MYLDTILCTDVVMHFKNYNIRIPMLFLYFTVPVAVNVITHMSVIFQAIFLRLLIWDPEKGWDLDQTIYQSWLVLGVTHYFMELSVFSYVWFYWTCPHTCMYISTDNSAHLRIVCEMRHKLRGKTEPSVCSCVDAFQSNQEKHVITMKTKCYC